MPLQSSDGVRTAAIAGCQLDCRCCRYQLFFERASNTESVEGVPRRIRRVAYRTSAMRARIQGPDGKNQQPAVESWAARGA